MSFLIGLLPVNLGAYNPVSAYFDELSYKVKRVGNVGKYPLTIVDTNNLAVEDNEVIIFNIKNNYGNKRYFKPQKLHIGVKLKEGLVKDWVEIEKKNNVFAVVGKELVRI